jgi:hypothetical protein
VIGDLILRRFVARILIEAYPEAIVSEYPTPFGCDELREVENGFNTKEDHNKPPIGLPKSLTVYQTEFRFIIVDLMHAFVNAPAADDSNGQVSALDAQFGAGSEKDITN